MKKLIFIIWFTIICLLTVLFVTRNGIKTPENVSEIWDRITNKQECEPCPEIDFSGYFRSGHKAGFNEALERLADVLIKDRKATITRDGKRYFVTITEKEQ